MLRNTSLLKENNLFLPSKSASSGTCSTAKGSGGARLYPAHRGFMRTVKMRRMGTGDGRYSRKSHQVAMAVPLAKPPAGQRPPARPCGLRRVVTGAGSRQPVPGQSGGQRPGTQPQRPSCRHTGTLLAQRLTPAAKKC